MSPTTSLAAATRFSRLLRLADRRPDVAIRIGIKWLKSDASPPMLEVFYRAVSRLVETVETGGVGQSNTVSSLIKDARLTLAAVEPAIRRDMDLRLSFSIRSAGPGSRTIAVRLTDADDLERVAVAWDDFEWCDWLLKGFNALADGDYEAHLAFPPLRLYPVGNYIVQLADALTRGQSPSSFVPERVAKALRHHLSGEGLVNGQDASFWHLFRLLGGTDPNAFVARSFVPRLSELDPRSRVATVHEICAYAWDHCATEAARAEFMEQLFTALPGDVAGWKSAALLEDACSWPSDWINGTSEVAISVGKEMDANPSMKIFLEDMLAAGKLPKLSALVGGASRNGVRGMVEQLGQRRRAMVEEYQMPDPIDADELLLVLESAR